MAAAGSHPAPHLLEAQVAAVRLLPLQWLPLEQLMTGSLPPTPAAAAPALTGKGKAARKAASRSTKSGSSAGAVGDEAAEAEADRDREQLLQLLRGLSGSELLELLEAKISDWQLKTLCLAESEAEAALLVSSRVGVA